jgi:hypothetical protein
MMSGSHAFIIRRYGQRSQQRKVLGITDNPPTRIAAKGLLWLLAAGLVSFATLALAGTARAEPVTQPTSESSSASGGAPSETGATVTELPAEAPSPLPPLGEQPAETSAPVSEQPTETGATVTEPPAEATSPTPPVSEPVEAHVPVSEVKETLPEPTSPVKPIVVSEVTTPITERIVEVTSPTTGQAQEPSATSSGATQADEASATPTVVPSQGAPPPGPPTVVEASGPLVTATAVTSPIGELEEPSHAPALIAPVRLTVAQRAADLSCQLSGLSRAATQACTVGWANTQSFPTASAVLVAGVSTTTGTGGSPGGGYGGSTGGGRTVIPPPGPAPSGSFGGSAAGGSGIALSGFFTLAGLLLLAGPLAMRRLRLSCQPWLTAFFVLIPERPG